MEQNCKANTNADEKCVPHDNSGNTICSITDDSCLKKDANGKPLKNANGGFVFTSKNCKAKGTKLCGIDCEELDPSAP